MRCQMKCSLMDQMIMCNCFSSKVVGKPDNLCLVIPSSYDRISLYLFTRLSRISCVFISHHLRYYIWLYFGYVLQYLVSTHRAHEEIIYHMIYLWSLTIPCIIFTHDIYLKNTTFIWICTCAFTVRSILNIISLNE
jgi:hypothetical protein